MDSFEIELLTTAKILCSLFLFSLMYSTFYVLSVANLFMMLLMMFEKLCAGKLALMRFVIAIICLSGEDMPAWIRLRYIRAGVWKR